MSVNDPTLISSHALALQKFTSALGDLENMFNPVELVQLAQNFIKSVNPPLPVNEQERNRGSIVLIKEKMDAIQGLLRTKVFNDRSGQDVLLGLLFSQVGAVRTGRHRPLDLPPVAHTTHA